MNGGDLSFDKSSLLSWSKLGIPMKGNPEFRSIRTVFDDDVVVIENSETKEEDVKEDESYHNKERYTFEDDDDDGEFDDLD
ncbi:hypothetical protein Tco_1082007 [Tanacetum coccineum]|uniref:Uncharacterized protein n=1 Tax=Tanacetum coccineum TaxID=301880 RepID=A0ABQ5I0V5_9ASTR